MSLYNWKPGNSSIDAYEEVSLSDKNLKEKDLRSVLAAQPEVLDEELLVIDKEFSHWADSRRSVDILGLRRSQTDEFDAKLVVIELKRDDSRDAELQAIRYAAMCSVMRFEDILEVHASYLAPSGEEPDTYRDAANDQIKDFLEWEEIASGGSEEVIIGNQPEIMIVAKDFNTELTTTVLHLTEEYGLPIECMSIGLYDIDGELFLHARQLLPLPEAEEYQVKKKQKEDETRNVTRSRRTSRILADEGVIEAGTKIEFIHEGVPPNADGEMLKAEFADPPTGNKNVRWKYDGENYSLSTLTEILRDKHDFDLSSGGLNGYWFWTVKNDPDDTPLRKRAKNLQ